MCNSVHTHHAEEQVQCAALGDKTGKGFLCNVLQGVKLKFYVAVMLFHIAGH